ncbi:hypothetical protein [Sphingomonas sp. AX6]|uniref:hypothetical protein n=1 Tax=Sphingomonas sp. AX6 TaxID=2653171 RepID=UPI00135AE017|nr:hypothetical protein [Sphingomonas sp. AX6]
MRTFYAAMMRATRVGTRDGRETPRNPPSPFRSVRAAFRPCRGQISQSIIGSSWENNHSPRQLRDGMAADGISRHRMFMFELSREMIAYGIVAVVIAIGVPWLGYTLRRRKRERLRRRGVKTYGH